MAIGTAAALGLGLGAQALGGFLNSRNQNRAARRQDQYNQQARQQAMGMVQSGPSVLEQMGAGMLQNWQGGAPGGMAAFGSPMVNMMSPGQRFNSGQDGLMQSLNVDPRQRVDQTLGGIIDNQGNPFDTSALFQALGVTDAANTEKAVAATRAGAGGLGQRFGSYMARQEGDMRTQANNNAATRNAGIAMQSQGDAQQRLLAALGMASGREQFGTQMGMQGQQNQMQLLQTLLGAQQGRMGQNAQLAGMGYGMGQPVTAPGYGGMFTDLGQMGMMAGLMGQSPYRRGGR